jgi:hypothetical protein
MRVGIFIYFAVKHYSMTDFCGVGVELAAFHKITNKISDLNTGTTSR